MSQSPDNEQAHTSEAWLEARNDLAEMIKRGRSFSGHERNCCFLNTGGERFATVSAISGLDFADDARAVAIVDWDQDGDLDAWISNRNAPRVRFMRNDAATGTGNHFLAIRLEGNGTTTNRDAIGARVVVIPSTAEEEPRWIQTLRAGEGFLSQSSKWLHFGTGRHTSIARVTVHWPGGVREEFQNLQADQRYLLRQSSGVAEVVTGSRDRIAVTPSVPTPHPDGGTARVPLITRLPMPTLTYEQTDGKPQQIAFQTGRPVLLHLWASWCQPCVHELAEYVQAESELKAAGIDILALSVDGLGNDDSTPARADALLRKLEFPFATGHATPDLLDTLQTLHNELVVLWEPLPVPTSFLVDREGRLASIYKGPASVAEIIQDAAAVEGDYGERFARAAFLPGSSLDHPRVVETAATGESSTRYRVAGFYEASGRLDDALAAFAALAEQNPRSASPLRGLASIYLQQRRLDLAIDAAQRALAIDPEHAFTHNTLGLALVEAGRLAEAEHHYRQAIEHEPDLPLAYNNLGTLLAGQGKLGEAQQLFLRAVTIDPKFAEAHTNLGSVFAARNELREAAKHYQLALRGDPNYAEAHNNLGTVYAGSGDFTRAIACYQRAVELRPDYREAIENLKRARRRQSLPAGIR